MRTGRTLLISVWAYGIRSFVGAPESAAANLGLNPPHAAGRRD
jgi:hypothetical protein